MTSPSIHNKRREHPIGVDMFLEGKSIDEVMALTGLKRSTCHYYLWIARSKLGLTRVDKPDPLME